MTESTSVKELTLAERIEDCERARARLRARIEERRRTLGDLEREAAETALRETDERALSKASARIGATRDELQALERALKQSNQQRSALDREQEEATLAADLEAVVQLERARLVAWKSIRDAIDAIARHYGELVAIARQLDGLHHGPIGDGLLRALNASSHWLSEPPLFPKHFARLLQRTLEHGAAGRAEVDITPSVERRVSSVEGVTLERLRRQA